MTVIKQISPIDKQRVLQISARIWEGDDYVANVFDEWISDDGLFAGLWEDEILVGFGKLTWLSPTDVWLEGLRKDETANVIGVGEKLSQYYINYLKGKKIDSIRFSTYFNNLASIKLNEKLGFVKILELSLKNRSVKETQRNHKNAVSQDIEFTELVKFVQDSEYLKAMKNNLCCGWVVHKYDENFLSDAYQKGRYVIIKEGKKISSCVIWSDVHYDNVFWISFWQTNLPEHYFLINDYLNELAWQAGKKEIQMVVPDCRLLKICTNLGFGSWEQEHDFYLYELPRNLINGYLTD
jgi:hypothetical protein